VVSCTSLSFAGIFGWDSLGAELRSGFRRQKKCAERATRPQQIWDNTAAEGLTLLWPQVSGVRLSAQVPSQLFRPVFPATAGPPRRAPAAGRKACRACPERSRRVAHVCAPKQSPASTLPPPTFRTAASHSEPPASSFQLPASRTPKSFRMRSYEKRARKSFGMHCYKIIGLKVPWNEHLQKKAGGGSARLASCAQPACWRDCPLPRRRALY